MNRIPPQIQGAILDVDGVLTGTKQGFNCPHPHPFVTERLSLLKRSGLAVVLCTGRPIFSIHDMVREAHLDGFHISNMGTVIANPLTNVVFRASSLAPQVALEAIRLLRSLNLYCEVYTPGSYFRQPDANKELAQIHSGILHHEAESVADLAELVAVHPIVKVLFAAKDLDELTSVRRSLSSLDPHISLNGGIHPLTGARQWCAVTAPAISKGRALLELTAHLGIAPAKLLAVSDSHGDWEFMKHCGFVAAPANAEQSLKELIRARSPGSFYLGPHVDEHGILNIFDHFQLSASSRATKLAPRNITRSP